MIKRFGIKDAMTIGLKRLFLLILHITQEGTVSQD